MDWPGLWKFLETAFPWIMLFLFFGGGTAVYELIHKWINAKIKIAENDRKAAEAELETERLRQGLSGMSYGEQSYLQGQKSKGKQPKG